MSRTIPRFATGVLCLLLVAHPEAGDTARAAAPQPPLPRMKTGRDGAPMALIPAGGFVMGSREGDKDEEPSHPVSLKAYYMDVYEVTVARYALFLAAVNAERPLAWQKATNGSHDDKPVVGIDWYDAAEYCEWVGRRLPTEAEWEKAARGVDERRYPWGHDAPTDAHARFNQSKWEGYATVGRVGSRPRGQSPYGIQDMAGNVWEWVADRYDKTYYAHSPVENPTGSEAGPLRVLRGGAWSNHAESLRASNRGGYPPSSRRSDFGFRCAADPGK